MFLDSIIAAALLALFIGWGVTVLFVTLYHLAGTYLSTHIELLQATTRNGKEEDVGRLKHWMDKWFGARIGFVAYHICRRVGLGAWQEVVEACDVVHMLRLGVVMFWEYHDRRGEREVRKSR